MSNNLTVIDFSLSGIRVIYGYFFQGKVYVLQSLESAKIPLDENGLLSRKETVGILNMLLNTIKSQQKISTIDNVVPLYPAYGFVVRPSAGTIATMDQSNRITQMDFVNCCTMINKENKDKTKQIIYHEPVKFIDEYKREFIDFPLGQPSSHLSIKCYSHLIDSNVYEHYRSIINDLNLNVYFELVVPVAASMFINFFDAPADYVALDLEKEYIYVSRISSRHLIESIYIRMGINNVISNASEKLNVSVERGEELLNLFGLNNQDDFEYKTEENLEIPTINEAFRNGFNKIYEVINNFYHNNGLSSDIPIILYGIGGDISGITSLFAQKIGKPVKLFSPLVIGARSKNYVSALGALRASNFRYQIGASEVRKKENTLNYNRGRFLRED